MNSRVLFFNELKFRWRGSLLAMAAVLVAVLSVATALSLLKQFDRQTDREVYALQGRSQERMNALENEARVFAKSLGFNIFIHHRDQPLDTFYAEDLNTHYLTMEQSRALAAARFSLLNHLLPFLRRRYTLPDSGEQVIIAGLEGEIYIKQKFQEPLEVAIQAGEVQLGHAVARRLNKQVGDTLTLEGREYAVTLCREQLGTKDDIIIFMNLGDAQRLLGLPDKLSGIMALSCNCAAGEITPIRESVRKVVPEADVVELTIRARARQQARKAIGEAAAAEVADIIRSRGALRVQLHRFSALFTGVMVVSASVLLLFLYGHNIKERRHEIAILRTLGARTSQLLALFAMKALLLGSAGALCGFALALLLARWIVPGESFGAMRQGGLFLILFAVANLISLCATLLPALVAAGRDPGIVLNEEA